MHSAYIALAVKLPVSGLSAPLPVTISGWIEIDYVPTREEDGSRSYDVRSVRLVEAFIGDDSVDSALLPELMNVIGDDALYRAACGEMSCVGSDDLYDGPETRWEAAE